MSEAHPVLPPPYGFSSWRLQPRVPSLMRPMHSALLFMLLLADEGIALGYARLVFTGQDAPALKRRPLS